MKKLSFILLLVLIFALCACSFEPIDLAVANIETLSSWSFQYNAGTNDYSLFFALLNKANEYTSADVNVDIRIVNDDGAEVYKATHFVERDDFGYYTSQTAGDQYLANVRIPTSQITAGTNVNGKVYLTVYKGDSLRFNEVNCTALYCLPIMDTQLVAEDLPKEISVKDYYGKIESKIKVEEVTYIHYKNYTSTLKISFAGTKTYGKSNSSYDTIFYKVYDSKGYVVDSGKVYLSNLVEGDKFKDDSIIVYNVVPGETYTINFSEYTG